MNYFHGGVPGLVLGDRILPPSITGVPSCAAYGAEKVCRTDRVYVTTNANAAVIFAATHPSGRGQVYRVEPEGELEPDADCMEDGLSFQAPSAVVVECLRYVPSFLRKVRKAMGVRL